MTTFADVHQNLAVCVKSTGLDCKPYQLRTINAPVAHVGRRAFDPRLVFESSKAAHGFYVVAYVLGTEEEAAQVALNAMCEPTGTASITAAVQNSALWTAPVDYAQVVSVGSPTWVEIGISQFASVIFEIEVLW